MSKILITGTGRCGTTFLIKLFTFLDFDTGYDKINYSKHIFKNCNSGMERHHTTNYHVIKNPDFLKNIDDIIKSGTSIQCVVIPVRDFEEAARSREKLGPEVAGGLLCAKNKDEQILYYNKIMSKYICIMTKYDINTIFIDFYRMISDKTYLYEKLRVIFDEKNIDFEKFSIEYDIVSESSKPKS